MEEKHILKEPPQDIQDFLKMPNGIAKNIKFYGGIEHIVFFESSVLIRDNKVYYSDCKSMIVKNKKSFYVKRTDKTGFTFDKTKNKLDIWFGKSIFHISEDHLLKIFKILKCDWFNEKHIRYITKALCQKVLSGKITNQEDYLKAYIKTEKLNISFKLMKSLAAAELTKKEIRSFTDVGTNHEDALKVCLKIHEAKLESYMNKAFNYDFVNLIMDTILLAQKLERKINFKWSFKRMQAEHDEMVDEVMRQTVESLSDNPTPLLEKIKKDFSYPGFTIITNEKDLYKEGETLKHCIYTNYKERIINGNYFAFQVLIDGERATLGLRRYTDKILYDQCYGYKNSPVSSKIDMETIKFINKFNEYAFSEKIVTQEPILSF